MKVGELTKKQKNCKHDKWIYTEFIKTGNNDIQGRKCLICNLEIYV